MSAYDDIVAQVYQGLRPFARNDVALSEDSELVGDLGLDSVQVMEMLLEIEDRFGISIPVNILAEVVTIRDLASQIERLTRE
ncbi:MAG: acyl carrier protein [Chromatiales bacterium 21-64-14]|nr:MAG: acyl carrier protein [Chromatiales bacterium 21-64-14]HQU14920.1 acyl carrier protein [Gammaproteobacteria bacterium]